MATLFRTNFHRIFPVIKFLSFKYKGNKAFIINNNLRICISEGRRKAENLQFECLGTVKSNTA
jgi:hypothetical protein